MAQTYGWLAYTYMSSIFFMVSDGTILLMEIESNSYGFYLLFPFGNRDKQKPTYDPF